MQEIRTNIDNHGKMLIPSKLRKELGLKQGDTLVLRKVNNEFTVTSLKSVLTQIQDDFKKRSSFQGSAVEAFLAMRREEAEMEKRDDERFSGKSE